MHLGPVPRAVHLLWARRDPRLARGLPWRDCFCHMED